jgi:hypothetical protein
MKIKPESKRFIRLLTNFGVGSILDGKVVIPCANEFLSKFIGNSRARAIPA